MSSLLVLTCINALANAIGELNSEVETIKLYVIYFCRLFIN